MKNIRNAVALLFLIGMSFSYASAQKTVSPTGGEAIGTAGSVSYTVGQLDYVTDTGPNGSVAQGVQQPWEISTVVSITSESMTLQVKAYPNPVVEQLFLELEALGTGDYAYRLTDLHGKVLRSGSMDALRTMIPVSEYAAGAYLLTVTHNQTTVKVFKIIKPN